VLSQRSDVRLNRDGVLLPRFYGPGAAQHTYLQGDLVLLLLHLRQTSRNK
jgi:hypothetical protein